MPRPRTSRRLPALAALLLIAGPGAAQEGQEPSADRTLTLPELLETFRADAPTVRQLAARAEEAKAAVRLATAAALPVLAAQGGYTRHNADAQVDIRSTLQDVVSQFPVPVSLDTSALPGALVIQPLEVWTAAASLTVPLVAPSAWADIAAAQAGAEAAAAQVQAAQATAEAALVRAAWLGGVAEQQVAATRHGVDAARAHAEAAARHLDAGLGTRLEVLAAEVELDRRRSEQAQAEADLRRARRALGALLGTRDTVAVRLPREMPGPTPSADEAQASALRDRPELVATRASWKATVRQATSAWLRHLPTIQAQGSLAAQTVPFPTGQQTAWRLGVQLTWVFYDGGARYGLLRRARAQRAAAEALRDQTGLDVAREAADAVDAVAVAEERLVLGRRALAAADEAEASAARAYEAGLLTGTEVLDAQQRRLEAALGQAAAEAALGIARADLDRARGARP
ncbi:MAG: TolC family protein [Alphaproteobacteria bacterium]|nr:TolC family protein [Alphaproteobacteria bacterium]